MIEQWREAFYFFGFLSSLAFGARTLLQWLMSELKKESRVTVTFWKLSFVGNIFLLIHAFIQLQFHIGLVQTCNAVISWRNLNLLQPAYRQISFKQTVRLLISSLSLFLVLFILSSFLLEEQFTLFRVPITPWSKNSLEPLSPLWHLIGISGLLLFNSRFWIQWWLAECKGESYIGPSFWWISLIGDLLCLTYFCQLGDTVNLIGPLFGLIPYIRNLMLLYKYFPSSVSNNFS